LANAPANTADAPPSASDDDDADIDTVPTGTTITQAFDSSNKVFLPDPTKPGNWIPAPANTPTTWTFQPGELCPVPRVRVTRGDASIEMSFNALTGNVENENVDIP
jgi:hypothetical protein